MKGLYGNLVVIVKSSVDKGFLEFDKSFGDGGGICLSVKLVGSKSIMKVEDFSEDTAFGGGNFLKLVGREGRVNWGTVVDNGANK